MAAISEERVDEILDSLQEVEMPEELSYIDDEVEAKIFQHVEVDLATGLTEQELLIGKMLEIGRMNSFVILKPIKMEEAKSLKHITARALGE